MCLGAAAAAHDGPLAWGWLALTVSGVFLIEVAKNASGELFDFDSGADWTLACFVLVAAGTGLGLLL